MTRGRIFGLAVLSIVMAGIGTFFLAGRAISEFLPWAPFKEDESDQVERAPPDLRPSFLAPEVDESGADIDVMREAYSAGFSEACADVWSLSPDGSLYYDDVEYIEEDCLAEMDESAAEETGTEMEAEEQGEQDGYEAAFLLSPRGILCWGRDCWNRDDFSDPVSWELARDHVGKNRTVCGPVVSSRYAPNEKGGPTFLNLGKPFPDLSRFVVVIWERDRPKFNGPPEQLFDQKRICVTGRVETHEGIPEIEVSNPIAISLLKFGPSSSPAG